LLHSPLTFCLPHNRFTTHDRQLWSESAPFNGT
jgi:hypothetical protein